jgi:hypothetical protein
VAEVAAAGTSGGGGARTSGRGGVNPVGPTEVGVGGGAERRSVGGGAGRESAGRENSAIQLRDASRSRPR